MSDAPEPETNAPDPNPESAPEPESGAPEAPGKPRRPPPEGSAGTRDVANVIDGVWLVFTLLFTIGGGLALVLAPSGSRGLGHAVWGSIFCFIGLGLFFLRSMVWGPMKIYRLIRPLPPGTPKRRWIDVVIVVGWVLMIGGSIVSSI